MVKTSLLIILNRFIVYSVDFLFVNTLCLLLVNLYMFSGNKNKL